MDLLVAAETDKGVVRPDNEDALLVSLPLVAVADGVGGHNAGEVASGLAVDVLSEWKPKIAKRGGRRLRNAALDANQRIYTRAQEDSTLLGMATTLTAAWIDAGTCTIAQVGDSRAYLVRDGSLQQLTEDQSVVAALVREGRITAEEAYTHPWRNRVLQALGHQEEVVVQMLSVDLQIGDRILLASDGLTDVLSSATIQAVLRLNTPGEMRCRWLVRLAKAAGSTDNITVALVDVVGNGDQNLSRFKRLLGRLPLISRRR
jgi:serine/threonine protein phosphatase PrpC